MPTAAPKACSHVGCAVLVRGSSRCEAHALKPWAKSVKATKRITGRRLQRMRTQLFARDPLCAECRRQGLVREATQRDHVIPLAEGGADDVTNEQGLCDECHDAKSETEKQRGLARTYGGVGVGQKSRGTPAETVRPAGFSWGGRTTPPGV